MHHLHFHPPAKLLHVGAMYLFLCLFLIRHSRPAHTVAATPTNNVVRFGSELEERTQLLVPSTGEHGTEAGLWSIGAADTANQAKAPRREHAARRGFSFPLKRVLEEDDDDDSDFEDGGPIDVREDMEDNAPSRGSNDRTKDVDEEQAEEVWRRVKRDMQDMLEKHRVESCSGLNGTYGDANTRVFCEGTLEVIGFPCLDCEHKFDWRDINSVRRCRDNSTCQESGFSYSVDNFGGTLSYIGQVPTLASGQRFSNHGNVQDSSTFMYRQREDSQFAVQITKGLNLASSFKAELKLPFGGLESEFSVEGSLSNSKTTQTTLSKEWTTSININLPPHSVTQLQCFLWANRFRGDFSFSLRIKGPVLVVVWNKNGEKEHPYFVYWKPEEQRATIEHWTPDGYQYAARVEGLRGAHVDCNKTIEFFEGAQPVAANSSSAPSGQPKSLPASLLSSASSPSPISAGGARRSHRGGGRKTLEVLPRSLRS